VPAVALAAATCAAVVACAAPRVSAPSTKEAAHERAERVRSGPAFAPPATIPGRYLRTLEHNPGGYDPLLGSKRGVSSGDLLLGDLLFHSPRTLGPRAQALRVSCNTCHPNGATHGSLFVEGLSDRAGNVDLTSGFFRTGADDGVMNAVNVPSLRGVRYTPPYGNDGRTASLSEFVSNVVTSEFDGAPLSQEELGALVRYVQDLDFLPNSNLDARGGLTKLANERAARGAAIFAQPRAGFAGMSCASCHVPTSFFRDGRVHRLGSADLPSPHALEGGYRTPTLLGLAETAPYFHDGRFATIADVVVWFDTTFALGLNAREREDLVAYVEAVGAVDRARDDRPLARKLDESFAYVSLLTTERSLAVWAAAIEAALEVLLTAPRQLERRVSTLAARLEKVRHAAESEHVPASSLVEEARAIRIELGRLAADWAGAVAAP
jgi:cytochrome c peroxidase